MYPAVVLTAMAAIGIEMVGFVLPKILVLFNDFHAALPLPTRILIFIVNFTEHYGIFAAIGFVLLVFGLIWLVKQPKVKRQIHALLLRLPIFGPIFKKVNLARFTLTLSSLLKSSVPIIDSVKITGNVLGNVRYRENLYAVSEALKKGVPLSESLQVFPTYFPPMVVQMLLIGEQTGQVEQMLQELSNYYENEVDNTMNNFSTIIEPVIILMLGVAVACIAVAVVMPMYSLAESF
jgi:type IV pilus assembly protein PilC